MVNKLPRFMVSVLRLFENLGNVGVDNGDFSPQDIHVFGITYIATNWVAWFYALIAARYIDAPFVTELCVAFALLHFLSPLLLRFVSSMSFMGSFVLACLIGQQIIFGYFSGGFSGNILVWYGVTPILAGVLVGARAVVFWSLVVLGSAGSFIYLGYQGYPFPQLIEGAGLFFAPFLTVFGWAMGVVVIIGVLILQQEEKEELLREKSDKINNLLRILTHDVSNSLNVINTASTLYQHYDHDQERVKYYFEKMDLASANINEVIQNVRTLHAAENEWESINLKSCRLYDCADYCRKLLEDRLMQKNLTLDIDEGSLKNAYAMIDPLFFNNHVLMNVLSNAVKFSEFGSRIKISAKRQGDLTALEVQDNGVGMDKQTLRDLFKEKWQKSKPGTAGEEGSGFGMLILKSFVERFGGKVKIESKTKEEGGQQGTKVTLLFNAPDSLQDFKRNDFGFGHFVVEGVETKKSHHVTSSEKNSGYKFANNFSEKNSARA